GDAEARLPQMSLADPRVVVKSQPQIQCQIAERDRVLSVGRHLSDVGVAVEGEEMAPARQVEGQESGQKAVARRVIESRISDPELESLGQKCVGGLHAEFGIMFSFG